MMPMRHWFDFLFPPRPDEAVLRNISIDMFLAHSAPQLVPSTRPETVVLLPLSEVSVRAAIHEAKYHGSHRAFEFLAAVLAQYLRDGDETSKPIIVPIPLSRGRRKERGFNQVEEVVKRALEGLDIEVDTTLLVRTRETASQVSLPRHIREENMRNAFKTTRSIDSSRAYIVLDDVLTTGATLQAAIDALKAGSAQVTPLALAH